MTSAESSWVVGPTTAKVVPYELPEIVKDLQELADFEWEAFLLKRVAQPLDELAARGGQPVRLQDSVLEPGSRRADEQAEPRRRRSLGPGFDRPLVRRRWNHHRDRGRRNRRSAGFAHGMKVIGVNNKTFSRQRMLDALAQSVKRHKIEFLLVEGEDLPHSSCLNTPAARATSSSCETRPSPTSWPRS